MPVGGEGGGGGLLGIFDRLLGIFDRLLSPTLLVSTPGGLI